MYIMCLLPSPKDSAQIIFSVYFSIQFWFKVPHYYVVPTECLVISFFKFFL